MYATSGSVGGDQFEPDFEFCSQAFEPRAFNSLIKKFWFALTFVLVIVKSNSF